jgi:hypothetical protein
MADRIPPHGTYSRYQGPRRHNRWQACRCTPCRAAANRVAKAQQLRRMRGIPAYVDRAPVADHVQKLLDAGWDKTDIAEAAKVSRRTVYNVVSSDLRTVQAATATALMKLRPEDAPNWRPALGATRRVRALSAMGWPLWWTAAHAGISDTGIRDICRGRTKMLNRATFEAIDRVYRKYAMRFGPSEAARRTARAKQWATAPAWNNIDDPADRPHSVVDQYTRRRRSAA